MQASCCTELGRGPRPKGRGSSTGPGPAPPTTQGAAGGCEHSIPSPVGRELGGQCWRGLTVASKTAPGLSPDHQGPFLSTPPHVGWSRVPNARHGAQTALGGRETWEGWSALPRGSRTRESKVFLPPSAPRPVSQGVTWPLVGRETLSDHTSTAGETGNPIPLSLHTAECAMAVRCLHES